MALDRAEKLDLSASPDFIYGFREGMFIKFFEQSLFRFIQSVRPLKPMLQKTKSGGLVIYGGLPVKSFATLADEGRFPGLEDLDYGSRWPFGGKANEEDDWPLYQKWRAEVLESAGPNSPKWSSQKADFPDQPNILAEIMAYDLMTSTPLETMKAVAAWQSLLRNRERAG
jgi:hypothetical protein